MWKSDAIDDADENEPVDDLVEQVEQDSADSEDITDLMTALLPNGTFPSASQFGLHYNIKLFQGWVKQPSACCAAASVAGAWNCLADLRRYENEALDHIDILNVYRSIMANSIEKKKKSFERCLGGSIDKLLTQLELEFCYSAGSPTPKCPPLTKSGVIRTVKRLVMEEQQKEYITENASTSEGNPQETDESAVRPLSSLSLIRELLESEDAATTDTPDCVVLTTTQQSAPSDIITAQDCDKDCGENGPGDDEGNTDTIMPPMAPPAGKSAKQVLVHNAWDWKSTLFDIVKKVIGLRKLSHALKPSTAPIGNWGILSGIQHIIEVTSIVSTDVSSKLFMGKGTGGTKSRIEVPLSRKDTPGKINYQWDALRTAFADHNRVLLFHLKNHYALIFALREWVESISPDKGNGSTVNIVREILTSRRGQRPSAWISFSEARETMLGWEGYKIIALDRANTTPELLSALRNVKSILRDLRVDEHFRMNNPDRVVE